MTRIHERDVHYIGALLIAVLVALAFLQYRWISDLSHAREEEMRATLASAVSRFADDLDREVTRAFFAFQLSDEDASEPALARRMNDWKETAPWPDLVKAVYLLRIGPEGRSDQFTRVGTSDTAVSEEIPDSIRVLQNRVAPGRGEGPRGPVIGEVPALMFPLGPQRGRDRFARPRASPSYVIVELDRDYLVDVFLPELEKRHFSSDFAISVFGRGGAQIYATGELGITPNTHVDVSRPILTIRSFPELRNFEGLGFAGSPGGSPAPPRAAGDPPRPGPPRGGRQGARPGPEIERPQDSPWLLEASHRLGSLQAAVRQTRNRNLMVSLGVLSILAASIVMMSVSLRRVQRLSRQQMEFVAGVTHELNTPLAAIRSAGQNLADGVIKDPKQVEKYGETIAREGRRLSDMVGEVLEFAGIQSEKRGYLRNAVDVAAIVREALRDCEWLIRESSTSVEVDLPELPTLGDADALRRVFINLIQNALKYAGGRPVRIQGSSTPRGVTVTIADQGPGISSDDLPHIFEPFYRGRAATRSQRRGSGLGLSIVKRIIDGHDGAVSVTSELGKGSRFQVTLSA